MSTAANFQDIGESTGLGNATHKLNRLHVARSSGGTVITFDELNLKDWRGNRSLFLDPGSCGSVPIERCSF